MIDALSYYKELDARLELAAHIGNATPMKKYMKNHFEFYGIKSPERKKIVSQFKKDFGLLEADEIEDFVHLCWDNPHRELQYACMELISKEKNINPERLELYEWMVLNKSWWDSVDFIAPTLMGKLFKLYPDLIAENTNAYVNSKALWLQRSALIFQLRYRENTDLRLLFQYGERLAEHPDFFIRKAIGWSLRQAGKFFPDDIREFVANTTLSKLSEKEALRLL